MVLSAFQAVWHLSLGSNTVRVYASCYTVALVGLHHSPALILLSVKCEHPSFLVVDDTIMMLLFLLLSSLLILSVFGEGMSAVGRPRSWAALPSRAFKYCPARGCPVRRFKQCCFDPTCYHPRYCSFMKPMKPWVMGHGSWSSSSLKYCTASSIGCRFRRFKQCCFHPTCRRRYPRYWHLHCQLGYMGRQTIIVTHW